MHRPWGAAGGSCTIAGGCADSFPAAVLAAVDRMAMPRELSQGILCDGLTSALAAVFHVSPMVTYSANIGLLKLTGVKSRFIVGFAAAMIAALGFVLCGGS